MRIGKKIVTFMFILMSAQVLSKNCEDSAQALARITPSGLEKIVKMSLEEATPYIYEGVSSLEKQDFEIKADPKKCSSLSLKAMEIADSYKNCPGFPKFLVAKDGIPFSELKESAKAVPTDFSLNNLGVSDIELGTPKVDCKGLECEIEIPVNKFQVNTDFKASEMGKKNNYLDIEGLTVTVKATDKTQPKLKFKARLGEDGTLENFISFPDNFLGANLKMENLSVGVGGKENMQAFAQESMDNILSGDYLTKTAEDFAELAATIYGPDGDYKHLSRDERYKLAQEYVSKKMDFTVGQIASSAANTGVERAMSYTKGDLSALTYLVADGLTNNEVPIMDIVLQKALPQVTKSVEDITRDQLKPFTKDLPFVHEPFNIEMLNLRAQDIVDNEQIDHYKRKIEKLARDCMKKFSRRKCRFDERRKLKRLLQESSDRSNIAKLDDINKTLNEFKKFLLDNPGEGFFSSKRWKKNLVKDIDKFLGYEEGIKKKISNSAAELEKQLALNVAVKQVVVANENLDILVSACSAGCTDLSLSNVESRTFPETDKKYDMATTVNLEAINDYIESIQKQGMLDVCLVEGIMVHCGDSNILGTENKIKFKKAPRIEWNEEKKLFLLKIEDIHRNQDIIGIPSWVTGSAEYTSIEVPFEIKLSDDGKEFSLSPKGKIKTNYDTDKNKLLLPTVLTFAVAPYAGVAFEVLHRGAHSALLELGEGAIAEGVSSGIRLEDNIPVKRIVDIQHNGSEVTVFTEISDKF